MASLGGSDTFALTEVSRKHVWTLVEWLTDFFQSVKILLTDTSIRSYKMANILNFTFLLKQRLSVSFSTTTSVR